MTELLDILPNRGELISMLEQGYVRKQDHPTEPLFILNYTQKAMFEGVWNTTTRTCRGLIINRETDEVVARPFAKFHNYGEKDAAAISLGSSVNVTDKMDGSLGIRYWQPVAKKWAIATRGSFTSEQALHGTQRLQEILEACGETWTTNYLSEWTELFEIVYPENRIVLDYGDLDDLVYLGCVNIRTGQVLPADGIDMMWTESQGIGCTKAFPEMTFAEALAMPPRPNAEGIVVTTIDGKYMLKVKQSDYIALHRAISKLSTRTIWEAMCEGKAADDIKFGMPEEFWLFIDATYFELTEDAFSIIAGAKQVYNTLRNYLDSQYGAYNWSRKEFAAEASKFDCRNLLFLLLDERDIQPVVWKSIKPAADGPFFQRSEDVS